MAAEVLDASGKHVLLGAIDADVNFREPGYVHKRSVSAAGRSGSRRRPAAKSQQLHIEIGRRSRGRFNVEGRDKRRRKAREGFEPPSSNPLPHIDIFLDFDYKINGLIVGCRSCWSPLVRHVPR